ncbi:MAG: PLP-dependent aminotransferase family protein [Rhizobiales bacterium]|nr:PLP-dependent aminotransferase family protein [Hyphomicrobiales bacterium]
MNRPVQRPVVFDIGIDRSDREPLQSQIAREIRVAVLSGRLRPQSKLPSTRALAAELSVARATVVEAYEQLQGEGYVETRGGAATRIAAELPDALLAVPKPMAGAGPMQIRAERQRDPARPFRAGLVDYANFPHDDWGRILGRVWRNPPIHLLEQRSVFGLPELRLAIARHLYEWRGISCNAAQVIVTAGGADAFDLVRRACLKNGQKIWMEDPAYPTARRIFGQGGVTPVSVPVDSEGLVVAKGRILAESARAAFVTPARQYPTGVTMPIARRLELLAWAKDNDSLIVEDDYDSEFRYVGRPLPALSTLDTGARVVYSGSFSKVFSPLVRLGYLVVPPTMADAFAEARRQHDAQVSVMAQPALAEFMESGAFAVHIRRMRRIYAARRAALLEALKPGEGKLYEIEASPAGLMLMLRLPQGRNDEALSAKLLKQGIETTPLSPHHAKRPGKPGLLLSFAGFTESDLRTSAAKLMAAL